MTARSISSGEALGPAAGGLDFVPYTDVLLVLLLAACLFARTGIPRWRDLRQPLVLEMLVLAVLFVATYFALPIGYSEAYYIDTRPLPFASFFFIAACLALPRPDPATRRVTSRSPRSPTTQA